MCYLITALWYGVLFFGSPNLGHLILMLTGIIVAQGLYIQALLAEASTKGIEPEYSGLTKRTVKSVFEHGMLRPLEPLDLPEGKEVSLVLADF